VESFQGFDVDNSDESSVRTLLPLFQGILYPNELHCLVLDEIPHFAANEKVIECIPCHCNSFLAEIGVHEDSNE
jgi:hypothetical protein